MGILGIKLKLDNFQQLLFICIDSFKGCDNKIVTTEPEHLTIILQF